MDPGSLANVARITGLVVLIAVFVVVLVYALWPRNRAKFDRASRIPLEED